MKIFFSTMGIALAILLTASLISNTMVLQSINAQLPPTSVPNSQSSVGTSPTTTAPSTTTSLAPSSTSTSNTKAPSTGTQATVALTPQCIAAQNNYKTAKANFDAALKAYLQNPGDLTIFNNYMKALNAWVAAQNALYTIPNCPKPV